MIGLFSTLIDYMEDEDWKYEILEGETIIRFHFKGSAGRLLCYGEVDEEKYWLIFYSYMPVNSPPEKMASAAEFVTRANRGMRIGNFELDFDDGEIRYKTSLDVEGGELTPKMIDNRWKAFTLPLVGQPMSQSRTFILWRCRNNCPLGTIA